MPHLVEVLNVESLMLKMDNIPQNRLVLAMEHIAGDSPHES
jgi:hypothetical protein